MMSDETSCLGVAEGIVRSGLHRGVDLVGGDGLIADRNQLGHGAGRRGNALCGAVELAGKLGDNETDRLRGAGGVGNDVQSARSGSSQVALLCGPSEASGRRCRRESWS